MITERESMTLNEMGARALEVEERSDETPRARASGARPAPDPEVVAKPKRRQFTAEYRLRILEEADRCTQPGEVGGCFAGKGCTPPICRLGASSGLVAGPDPEQARRQACRCRSAGSIWSVHPFVERIPVVRIERRKPSLPSPGQRAGTVYPGRSRCESGASSGNILGGIAGAGQRWTESASPIARCCQRQGIIRQTADRDALAPCCSRPVR